MNFEGLVKALRENEAQARRIRKEIAKRYQALESKYLAFSDAVKAAGILE